MKDQKEATWKTVSKWQSVGEDNFQTVINGCLWGIQFNGWFWMVVKDVNHYQDARIISCRQTRRQAMIEVEKFYGKPEEKDTPWMPISDGNWERISSGKKYKTMVLFDGTCALTVDGESLGTYPNPIDAGLVVQAIIDSESNPTFDPERWVLRADNAWLATLRGERYRISPGVVAGYELFCDVISLGEFNSVSLAQRFAKVYSEATGGTNNVGN